MRIVSGGQTGVDRSALDVAMELGLPVGGFCPRGRRAEDGRIPDKYPLSEMPTREYAPRTRKNVEESDATLILFRDRMGPGSDLTLKIARAMLKPLSYVDLLHAKEPNDTDLVWLVSMAGRFPGLVLNIAGSRESSAPGIYEEAAAFLRVLLAAVERP